MAKPSEQRSNGIDGTAAIVTELKAIRGLLMLLGLKIGATTSELGVALGVSKQRVSQLISASDIKRMKIAGPDAEE